MEDTAPLPALHHDPAPEIAALALRYKRANGPLIAVMNRLGGSIEAQVALLPAGLQDQIEGLTRIALEQSYRVAGAGRLAPRLGPRAAPALAALTGAAGGLGGLPTALAELPFTITLILHSIRGAATAEGFDPDHDITRLECLRVFGAASPLSVDEGVNTSFLGARLTLTGPALQRVIAAVAPRLAAALGQKLAAQAVPVLGAVAGATLNAAYLGYYREMAQIRFALLRLAQTHGNGPVLAAFQAATAPARVTRA
ncbi:EcsC family protein [Fertoebacter nigrum]|uniref:EcsC family protein n=1 Tax=Fertoeibacter niger TaxID=2656921 RepID=A0A8X8GZ36_9RHOB|nr:EcsC family protein [Fertoeibacter niger]NUB44051.1 EcsC family protein [Fertoeibacter niger]